MSERRHRSHCSTSYTPSAIASVAVTEDGIRLNEGARDTALRDAFNLPGAPVVMAPADPITPLPPNAVDGPAYP